MSEILCFSIRRCWLQHEAIFKHRSIFLGKVLKKIKKENGYIIKTAFSCQLGHICEISKKNKQMQTVYFKFKVYLHKRKRNQ